MDIIIKKGVANGTVTAPPSKSVSHRALISAALSAGCCEIKNIAFSEDVKATINCLEALGAKFSINNDSVTITGINSFKNKITKELNCNESGSTLRFMIPICLLFGQKITLVGAKRLFERSLSVYEEIAEECGFLFEKGESSLTVCGKLQGKTFHVKGNISSQFISGLLFALPLANTNSEIIFTTKIESKPYIDMTISCLKDFGVVADFTDERILINGSQKYNSVDYTIEGDYSNAAFFEALNYLGHNVSVNGLKRDSLQGDKVYEQMFKKLDAGFTELDISNCPDLAPILMTVAAAKNGANFIGTKRLEIKESDRGQAISDELSKFGIKTEILENSITIFPGKICTPTKPINSHNDHRIVMSMAVLMTTTGGLINNSEAVNKSFPSFFDELSDLGIKIGVK